MDDRYSFQKSLKISYHDLKEILADKALSKFGDALVNFTYSLAKSIVLQMPTGEKVPDKTLGSALRATPLRQQVPSHAKIGTLGDAVEAFLAYMWLTDRLPLHHIIEILVENLKHRDLSDRKKERRAARDAYINLLMISMKIVENSPVK
jgi:hypothetical protein